MKLLRFWSYNLQIFSCQKKAAVALGTAFADSRMSHFLMSLVVFVLISISQYSNINSLVRQRRIGQHFHSCLKRTHEVGANRLG